MVLEFLLQQSEISFDGSVQQHERNKKILRCLLSWVRHYTDDSFGFCIFAVVHIFMLHCFKHGYIKETSFALILLSLSYLNMNIHLSSAS